MAMIEEPFGIAEKANRKSELKNSILVTGLSISYLLLSSIFIGFKIDQLVLVFLFNGLYYASSYTRKLILGFSVFIVFWILFDSMKAYPNYLFGKIHIKELYTLEKSWFGIKQGDMVLTPNEYANRHSSIWLDVCAGLFYLTWVPVPLAFAFYLFNSNKTLFLHFSLTFLLVNILGFIVYYLYPAAPPWYVEFYGFTVDFRTPGNPAGLSRFDDVFGISLFHSMYAKSSNVFAAMPSLHSAYPVIVLYYGLKSKLGWVNILFFIMVLGIWFSAVYSMHHYVLDVCAGLLCALASIALFNIGFLQAPLGKKMIDAYVRKIS